MPMLARMWPFDRKSRRVRSSQAYWLLRNGIGDAAPRAPVAAACDIAIVGAGITGALVADALVSTGARIVMLDAHEPGQGSTSASTALLQYEIDTHLTELTRLVGAQRAVRAYRAGVDSFTVLEQRFADLLPLADYERRPSLYLASDEEAVAPLQVEAAARRAIGLHCEWLEAGDVARRYGCQVPGAVLSSLGAQMDPLRFTRALLAGCVRHGIEIRTRTRVESVDAAGHDLALRLADGSTLSAKHVVICAGYESLRFLDREVADIDNTFALITAPTDEFASLPLVWESARPYLYMRTTRDRRLIVGGNDVSFDSVAARELLLPKQTIKLARSFEKLFGRPLPPVEYAWAGSFASTKDGLPYIGPVPGMHPRLQFALCYGGNGITYSVQAGDIVRAHVDGRAHALDDVFGFERSERSGTDPAEGLQEGGDLRLDPSLHVQDRNRQAGTPINRVPS